MTYTNEELLKLFEETFLGKPFNASENTITTYRKYLRYMLEFLNNKNILDITKKDVKSFMLSLDCSDSYYNGVLSSIKSLYKVLSYHPMTEDLVLVNPTVGIVNIKNVKAEEKVPLTQVEQEMLVKYSKNVRDKAIMNTLLMTGMRIHELINLTLEQYKNRTSDGMITLIVTKGSKERVIFLNEEVINSIEAYLPTRKEGSDKLFVSNQGTEMSSVVCSRTIKAIARRSGYFTEDRIEKLSNHLLRTTCLTDLANNGVAIQVVSQIAGHRSINTTAKVYIKNDLGLLKSAMC